MDISGVHIADGVRLLVPEDRSKPHLFHEIGPDEWCETVLPKRALRGSFDAGDISSPLPITCGGGHVVGSVVNGQWILIGEPTDD